MSVPDVKLKELEERLAGLNRNPLVQLLCTRDYLGHACGNGQILLGRAAPKTAADWRQEAAFVADLHDLTAAYLEAFAAMVKKT
jgi:hypothetical protein